MEIPEEAVDHGDPAGWDELPEGYITVIVTELEDRGWAIDSYDCGTVVHVIAADGTETGVWFADGRCWTGHRGGHGACVEPADIKADVTDPEDIAARADQAMRELGLKPSRHNEGALI